MWFAIQSYRLFIVTYFMETEHWKLLFEAVGALSAAGAIVALWINLAKFRKNEKQRDEEVRSLKEQSERIGKLVNIVYMANIDKITPFYSVVSLNTSSPHKVLVFTNHGKPVHTFTYEDRLKSGLYRMQFEAITSFDRAFDANQKQIYFVSLGKQDQSMDELEIDFEIIFSDGVKENRQRVFGTLGAPQIEHPKKIGHFVLA